MHSPSLNRILTSLIASIWFINGFFCKFLHGVPRHEAIVARILSEEYARPLTSLIGLAEIAMAIWIISGFRRQVNSILQIILIAAMNLMEALLVPDLLMWGRLNAVLAAILIGVIYFNGFVLIKENNPST